MPAAAITSASPSLAQVTPMRPEGERLVREGRRLLALGVGTPADARLADRPGDPPQVALVGRQVHDERRGIQSHFGCPTDQDCRSLDCSSGFADVSA